MKLSCQEEKRDSGQSRTKMRVEKLRELIYTLRKSSTQVSKKEEIIEGKFRKEGLAVTTRSYSMEFLSE